MDTSKVTLNCAGSYSGKVTVSLQHTVAQLREQILNACLDNDDDSCNNMKLIVGGRNFQDLEKTLQECGVTAASRILVLRQTATQKRAMHANEAAAIAAEEREQRIKRLKHAVESMAGRDDSRSHRSLTLENQEGQLLNVDAEEQRLIMMGMVLSSSGRRLMKKEDWTAALVDLEMALESFDLCKSDLLKSTDNVPLLLLDIVWCMFKLQDGARLAGAHDRLQRARTLLAVAHGPHMERLRVLHGNFRPELAIYLRMDVLEGLGLFYGGDMVPAKLKLQAAKEKWLQLRIDDEALTSLLAMDFSVQEASRALRFCGGDVSAAAEFVLQQREEAARRRAADRKRRALRRELEFLGRTPTGKNTIDLEAVEVLEGLGFDRLLAAEALRLTENDKEAALNILTSAEQMAAMQMSVVSRTEASTSRKAAERHLIDMGFEEFYVREALKLVDPGDVSAALQILGSWTTGEPGCTASATPPQIELGQQQAGAAGPSGVQQQRANQGAAAALASAAVIAAAAAADNAPPKPSKPEDTCDYMMEEEVAALTGQDPLSGYDIDVTDEEIVIHEFLARLEKGVTR